jgi:hypothetical protein
MMLIIQIMWDILRTRTTRMTSTLKPAALVALLSFAIFAPSLTYDFVNYDDQRILLGQPLLFGPGPLAERIQAIFTALPREEPLLVRDLSWLIETRLFGFGDPLGHHLGNVLIHAANTLLLLLFLSGVTGRFRPALAATLLFAMLPIHVEPVCWVMGRKDLLSVFFMLAALTLQDRTMQQEDRGPMAWTSCAVTAFLTACAMLSKISAAPFFVVLLLHRLLRPYLRGDRAPDARLDPSGGLRSIGLLLPHALISLTIFLWYRAQLQAWGMFDRGPTLVSLEHLSTLATILPQVFLRYFQLMVIPRGYALFYDDPAVGVAPPNGALAAGLIVTIGLMAALAWSALKNRAFFFWLGSALLLMLPYLNLIYIGIWVANRYVYLVSALLIAAVVFWLDEVTRSSVRIRKGVLAGGLLFGLLCLVQTLEIQAAWRDNRSLWTYEVSLREPSMLAMLAMARVHVKDAEAAKKPAQMRDSIQRAEALIRQASEKFEARYSSQPGSYQSYQLAYYGTLMHWEGRIMLLEGRPAREQLPFYLRAQQIQPSSRLHNMQLVKTYFKMAFDQPDDRARLGRESLKYFEHYVRQTVKEGGSRAPLTSMLERNYRTQFPELADEVDRIRRSYGL